MIRIGSVLALVLHASVFSLPAQEGGPPVYETIQPSLASPAPGALYEIPVVILRYLPTADGHNLNLAYDPDYWHLGPITLDALEEKIDVMDRQVKFGLEEASRFRGYRDPGTPPALGYRVVDYITIYEPTPPGRLVTLPNGKQVNQIDYHQIFRRFNGRRYVEELGVKEFWLWSGTHDYSYPSFDPSINQPGTGRLSFESNMSSPTTGDISNSDRNNTDLPVYSKTFVLYHQNFRRTASEALHNHGHQLESILSYAATRQDKTDDLFWKQFVGREAYDKFKPGRAGWTHMPPNTTVHYDYTNMNPVASDIEDWNPAGTGALKTVNAATWTSIPYAWPDGVKPPQPDAWWYVYWMQNMPGWGNRIPLSGTPTSKPQVMSNWWHLTAEWDSAHRVQTGLHQTEGDVMLTPVSQRFGAEGGAGTVLVRAAGPWVAGSNALWIAISSTTTDSVFYRVAANPSVDPRSTDLAVGDKTFPVSQAGRTCTINLIAEQGTFEARGGETAVEVSVSPVDCAWSARTEAFWLSIMPPSSNTGNATLILRATENNGDDVRTGTLVIGDQTLLLKQLRFE